MILGLLQSVGVSVLSVHADSGLKFSVWDLWWRDAFILFYFCCNGMQHGQGGVHCLLN